MDKNLALIKQRILQYIDIKGFEKIKFFENLNISSSNFRGKAMYSEAGGDIIAKILSFDKSLSSDWLLTGRGNMFVYGDVLNEPESEYVVLKTDYDKRIEALENENDYLKKEIASQKKIISLLEKNNTFLEEERNKNKKNTN